MPTQIPNTLNLTIDGMTCQACATRIEKVLNKKPAIAQADVNYANETAHITFDPSQTNADEILDWVKKTGYTPHLQQADEPLHATESPKPPLRLMAIWICLIPFLIGMAGMMVGSHALMPPVWVQFVLATIVQFGLALPFYKSAWASIRGGLASMDVLVVLGTVTIWAYSTYVWLNPTAGAMPHMSHTDMQSIRQMPEVYFEASVMVIAFVRLGKYLEDRTKKHSLNSINLLLALTPEHVEVKTQAGTWQSKAITDVQQGDILLAKAGSRIGTDGVVMAGEGWCDESHLTGESVPLAKRVGDTVMAGAMVDNGSFEYQVTATGRQTQLGDMITALHDAQGSKANIARLADNVVGIFVPVVVAIAVLTFGINFWLLADFETALMRAVAVLVIACPCALGLATPAAIMAGMGVSARHGVWFKDAQALESAGSVDTVVLDKTGTITEGRPDVVAHAVVDASLAYDEILTLVASLEQHANHPLATALVTLATKHNLSFYPVKNVQTLTGQGIQGEIEGIGLVKVGTFAFTNFNHDVLAKDTEQGTDNVWQIASNVAVSVNDKPLAAFALADSLKADSAQVIAELQKDSLNVVIMSGDKQSVVDYIGGQVHANQAFGELSPRDKADKIAELQSQGTPEQKSKKVAMVGDGVNDAPAMATAMASFAVEGATDIAKHSATARLMGDSLKHVGFAIKIAQATLRNIKQNLFFAFIYNCLGIPLAAFGLLNPMIAAGAMALSSISVLLNALRLTRVKL